MSDEPQICAREGCDNIVAPGPPNKKYCSLSCGSRACNARRHQELITTPTVCARETCDRPLPIPRQARQKYCSPVCAKKAGVEKRRDDKHPPRKCDYCGQEFTPSRSVQRYCDPACAESDYNARRRQMRFEQGLFARMEQGGFIRTIEDVKEGERAFYIADLHYPFWEKELVLAVERAMVDYQPDRIFYVGDILDAYTLSVFDQNPTRLFDLEDEFDWVRQMLDRHQVLCPNAKRYWEDGNHEHRLQRYLWKTKSPLANIRNEDGDPLLSIWSVLGLKKRDILHVPFPGRLNYAGFVVTHGPFRRGGDLKHCAKWMSERVRSSGLCGHFHRNQQYAWVGDKQQSANWMAVGCLCDLNPDYDPYADWQWGFAYSQVINGLVHPTLVQPFDGRFQVEGVTYEYGQEDEHAT